MRCTSMTPGFPISLGTKDRERTYSLGRSATRTRYAGVVRVSVGGFNLVLS